MRKTVLGVIMLLSALWLTACGQTLADAMNPSFDPENDCGFVQNIQGQRISWKSNLPVRIAIHSSVPSQFYPALEAAMRKWETATGRPMFQIVSYNVQGPLAPRQDGVSLIYWMNTWESNRASEQARASVYWVGDEIREADIRINAKDFSYYVNQPTSGRDVHLESLVVHELGHVLGLKHKDTGGSVMATYLPSSTNRASVSKSDVESVRCEY
jgi:hypothetical protein